ncbi:MAG TPA: tetratricopeptide repeat protein, partial [Blastocatellia bacterium]|nr:tetratricopeptide repeat protein [Blastocatellia bacterium]
AAAATYPVSPQVPPPAATSPVMAETPAVGAKSKAPLIVGMVTLLLLLALAAGAYVVFFSRPQPRQAQVPQVTPQPEPQPKPPPVPQPEPPPSVTPEQVAASLTDAINGGRLITLSGDDAYTYYSQLKTLDPNHKLLREAGQKALPQLRRMGDDAFARKTAVTPGEMTAEEWARALRVYQWASELSPNDRALEARQRFAAAEVARLQNKPEEAERGFTAAAQIDPKWALPQNSLGRLRFDKKQYDAAIEFYNRAIELQPRWEIPYNNLGTAYFYKRDYDTAEQWYNKAIELNPKWPRPHVWLGEVYERKKMKEEALAAYQKALDLDPRGDYIDVATVKSRIAELQK